MALPIEITYSRPALLFAFLVSLSLYVLFSLTSFALRTRRPPSFPPGPPTLPFIGNLHQIPLKKPFLQFEKWRAEYGDIIGLKFGPNNFVVLSDPAHVRELFQRRAAYYSGRPSMRIPQEYVMKPGDHHVLFMQDDKELRRWRAAASRDMTSSEAVARAAPLQAALAQRLLRLLAREPGAWNKYSSEWSLGTPLLCLAGQSLDDYPDGFGEHYFEIQKEWVEFLEPGNTPPVDIFPILGSFPSFLAPWKRRAEYMRSNLYSAYNSLLNAAKEKATTGSYHSYTPVLVRLLRERENLSEKASPMTDSQVLHVASGMLDASVDSMHAVTEILLLLLISHPEKLKRAQAEADAVNQGRCPTEKHVNRVPYIKACILETMRFRTLAPLLIPRMLSKDDVFNGYHFPAGTTVVANVHAIHHRAEDYDDPESFVPERYLANPVGIRPELWDEEAGTSAWPRKATYAFGAGRRMCIGEGFALANLSIVLSKLLWAFDVSYPPGDAPDISWDKGFSNGMSLAPEKFRAVFRLREGRGDEIEEEYHRSKAELVHIIGEKVRRSD